MSIKVHLFGPPSAPGATTLAVKPGQSLMQVATANNVTGIEADCGGLLTCATCHALAVDLPESQH